MLFNSYEFLFGYLPIVFVLFFIIAKKNHSQAAGFLGLASLLFYAWFSIQSLPLLIGSIIVNYRLGLTISQSQNKQLLILGLILNLAALSFFKYANFLIENTNLLINLSGGQQISPLNIALPIGISFFTFTQIAFLVDSYQGKVKEKNFTHYLLFVTYFPHLIAGPVLHHAQMMPQFAKKETYQLNYPSIALGLTIFTIGLAKKILIANPLAEYADFFYNQITPNSTPTIIDSWLGALAYTFQIYFDFSGYSDMAIGISLLFGINLPINFNAPYQAKNVIDFWRRWHISLSTFLRDYLYIPIGGNKFGQPRRYTNLLITMIIGGLWHGANWTFILWGTIHGVLLAINHVWKNIPTHKYLKGKIFDYFSWAMTFIAIMLTWVIFRIDTIDQALPIYYGLFGINGLGITESTWGQLRLSNLYKLICISFIIIWIGKPSHQLITYFKKIDDHTKFLPTSAKYHLYSVCVFLFLMYCINLVGNYNPFLYFQF